MKNFFVQSGEMLLNLFGAIGGVESASKLAVVAGAGAVCPAFAVLASAAIAMQVVRGRKNAKEAESLKSDLDQLVTRSSQLTETQTKDELIQLLDIPTNGGYPSETPALLLAGWLQNQFQELKQGQKDIAQGQEDIVQGQDDISQSQGDLQQGQDELGKLIENLHEDQMAFLQALLYDEATGLPALLGGLYADIANLLHGMEQNQGASFQRLEGKINQLAEFSKEENHPRIYFPRRTETRHEESVSDRLNFRQQRVSFLGRREELRMLREFLKPHEGVEPDIRWWVWAAAAGMGKSRLALQFCLHAMAMGWRAGFLSDGNESSADWSLWNVDQPTLIVVDYAAGRPERIAKGLVQLLNSHHAEYPVRLLLLERTAEEQTDQWLRELYKMRRWNKSETLSA